MNISPPWPYKPSYPTFVVAPFLLVDFGNVLMNPPYLLEFTQLRQKSRCLPQRANCILWIDVLVTVGCERRTNGNLELSTNPQIQRKANNNTEYFLSPIYPDFSSI
jgi:hypothetical protein